MLLGFIGSCYSKAASKMNSESVMYFFFYTERRFLRERLIIALNEREDS